MVIRVMDQKAKTRRGINPQGYSSGGSAKFIKKAIRHPGALHRALQVPEGEKIPAKKIEKATHSANPTLARRARFAQTLAGLRKK